MRHLVVLAFLGVIVAVSGVGEQRKDSPCGRIAVGRVNSLSYHPDLQKWPYGSQDDGITVENVKQNKRSANIAMSDEMKEMAQMVHDQCVGESGVDEAAIENTKKGEFPNDQKLKCYLKCIYSNMGAITDEGTLDAEAFSSILPDDMNYMTPLIDACKGVTGSDGCETAMNFNICMYKTDPGKYLII